MTRSIVPSITCAIALALSGLAARAAQAEPDTVPPLQAMTNGGCVATAATDRVRCDKLARPGVEGPDQRCEDAINLQQRICMLQVLEGLHPGAPAQNSPLTETLPR
jgi:hypothetical protein